ncbi:MAG: carbon-nitrogen family hydrolase [Clostridia bacterium]|nr:carbon-nitrogen family hydrolase [Clostridia bacterium]
MKIACCQMNMKLADAKHNYGLAEQMLASAMRENPDVVFFPEMWNVGFFPTDNLKNLADNDGRETKLLFSALSRKFNVNIVAGSIADNRQGTVFNTAYVFDRNGEVIYEYDKCHLFSPMGEDKFFTAGKGFDTFVLDGKKCSLIICYDLRFPEITRKLALDGAQLLFVVSQWPEERIEHYLTLLRARAIENQIFVAACNSCGVAGNTKYGGNSVSYDPWGEELYKLDDREDIAFCDCDFEITKKIRENINVFADRRNDIYNL